MKDNLFRLMAGSGHHISLYPADNKFSRSGKVEVYATIDPETKEVKFIAVDEKNKKE